jgi:hypothetical protein
MSMVWLSSIDGGSDPLVTLDVELKLIEDAVCEYVKENPDTEWPIDLTDRLHAGHL